MIDFTWWDIFQTPPMKFMYKNVKIFKMLNCWLLKLLKYTIKNACLIQSKNQYQAQQIFVMKL